MSSKSEQLKKELDSLVKEGDLLYLAMLNSVIEKRETIKDALKIKGVDLPVFREEYDKWYSAALMVIKTIIPERYADFVRQYKNEKRKEVDFSTYTIYDYLLGLRKSISGNVIVDTSAAIPKMEIQVSILKSAERRFDSSLFDIIEVLQADLFDSELAAAKQLAKKGFVRGAGAMSGVVLERHLGHVCESHGLKSRKSHPSISDFNQLLKENAVIDTPQWRFIQHLTDLRNICDHNKDREPTKDDVLELIGGIEKIIKTVL